MSANNGILTYGNQYYQILSNYYSPTVTIPSTGNTLGALYTFVSKVDPWVNEFNVPAPTQDQRYLKQVFKNMFFAKKVTSNDMSPVVERRDWTTGTVYDYYRDDIDIFEHDTDGKMVFKFYIRNRFDQVFKCLWNANGEASTVEPYFEPGTFNANQIFQGVDGYKWKYMYTISAGSKLKFMDANWMPVPISQNIPNPATTGKGFGSLDTINIVNTGSGYDPTNSAITITVTGDGSYASANAVVTDGEIVDITVANTGINYTSANVTITSATGSGANAVAYASPVGGHGFEPVSELGTHNIMITTSFEKSESGALPTDIDFRQIGILLNPFARFGNSIGLANSATYKVSTDFVVSPGAGDYSLDEIVYQSPDGTYENATFSATLLSYDSLSFVAKLINIQGTATDGALLIGNSSGTARVVLSQNSPDFIPFSGYMIYLENRNAIQRNSDGSEQVRVVLGY